MKVTCETIETRTFTISPEDIQKIIAKELYSQYGVDALAANIKFDVGVDESWDGYYSGAFNGAVYVMQTRK